jgi:hypothetical protein
MLSRAAAHEPLNYSFSQRVVNITKAVVGSASQVDDGEWNRRVAVW